MKRTPPTLVASCALFALCCFFGCSSRGGLPRRIAQNLDAAAASETRQILYLDPGTPSLPQATLYPVQRGLLGWRLALPPVPANVGRNGIAPPFDKREGDGRTPSGMFPLSQAFGYPPGFKGRVPYRQVESQDLWVDDAQSPDYNRWVRRGETSAASYEELLRPDPLYKYALVVDYNSAPVVRDLGSAIFMHVERTAGAATAGCVTLAERELLQVMEWLDPADHPQVLVATPRALEAADKGMASYLPEELPPELAARLKGASRILMVKRGAGGFFAAAVSLPPQVERQMLEKASWRPGCPVAPNQLAYLVTTYWGFDGRPHYGELVVHAALSAFFVDSLHHAYNGRFPIERMELIEAFDADDLRSMEANNSSAFNCREVPGKPGVFSRHSYGAAIDINPLQNPYLPVSEAAGGALGAAAAATESCGKNGADCRVLPAASAAFLDRLDRRPGMLQPGDSLLTPFRQRGFAWGGAWRSPDYQHIEYDVKKLSADH